MKVLIPSPLLSYTRVRELDVAAASLLALFVELDRRFPGIRFRVIDEQGAVRRHMRVFVNGSQVADLDVQLDARDTVQIVQALSGG
jgi:molybdopterin converting factor small subunit